MIPKEIYPDATTGGPTCSHARRSFLYFSKESRPCVTTWHKEVTLFVNNDVVTLGARKLNSSAIHVGPPVVTLGAKALEKRHARSDGQARKFRAGRGQSCTAAEVQHFCDTGGPTCVAHVCSRRLPIATTTRLIERVSFHFEPQSAQALRPGSQMLLFCAM